MNRQTKADSGGLVRIENLEAVVDLLRQAGAKGLTKAQLAKKLDKSERTIARALDLLEEQGAKLTETRKKDGVKVWTLEAGPRWDERVSPEARLALQVALLALAGGGTEVWTRHLEGLQALMDERLSHADKLAFQRLRSRLAVHGAGEDPVPMDEGVLREVLKALSSEPVLSLRISYRAAGAAKAETREVIPHSLSHDLFGGGAFLLAWDVAKQAVRQFRLLRIESAEALGPRGLTPAAQQTLDQARHCQIGGWVGQEEPQWAEVAIHDPYWAQSLQEDLPALPDCELLPLKPGPGFLLRFRACEWNGPARWVLQFGSSAEVLGPAEFREHVAKRVRETAQRYAP
jgi:predicted DNA-binding transcriptional regulator YafY